MILIAFYKRSRPSTLALVGLTMLVAVACNSEVELTGEDGSSLPVTIGGGVSLSTVNNVAEASWTDDLVTGIPTFASQTLSFKGICSRGTSSIKAYLGGVLKTTATCTVDGEFTADVTATTDGVHQYELRPVSSGVESASAVIAYDLATDTTGPGSPVMTQGSSYAATGSGNFTIDGTVLLADGVATIVETNGNTGTLNFSSTTGTFTYSSSITVVGSTKTYKFVARDAVGNSSAATTIVISLIPSSLLAAAEIGPGVAITSSITSTNTLSTVTSAPVMSTTQPLVSGGSGNRLYGGLGAISVQGP